MPQVLFYFETIDPDFIAELHFANQLCSTSPLHFAGLLLIALFFRR